MPWPVFPKFRSVSALLAEKVDAVIRELAAILNGGLDVRNLKAGVLFPAAAFRESRALFALRCVSSDEVRMSLGGKLPAACRLVAVSAYGIAPDSGGDRWVKLYRNGALVHTLTLERPAVEGYEVLAAPVELAAGDVLSAETNAWVEVSSAVKYAAFLSASHVA